jgi:UDP-N-acetylmuramoyl-L-alanyl-D-glutamate--2,6-diaminopimelate ligase
MMITLDKLIKNIQYKRLIGNLFVTIQSLALDSRKVESDAMFIAIKGAQTDGHQFIKLAIEKGAKAIVCETIPEETHPEITYIEVDDTSVILGILASHFFDNPSQKLKLVGITGTNGKTTTATLLYRLVKQMGHKAGLISTVCNFVNEKQYKTKLTTPDAIEINTLLHEMVTEGCEYCFMEVSSHAVVQHRIAGLNYAGGIFTNITHDHLDYHKTFEEYLKAKKTFFDLLPASAFALVNTDDKNGRYMIQNTRANKYTYAIKSMANFKGQVIENHFEGMLLNFDNQELWTKLIGTFNAYNLLGIFGAGVLLGMNKNEALRILSLMNPVSGRFETIRSKEGITAIVDYAHTPDAIENVMNTINEIRTGEEQFITLVGAGGDRDKTKRPKMARIAVELADKVILTSDNPRTEKPEDIIEDMKAGIDSEKLKKVLNIVDRKEAIKTAVALAGHGDIILIPGKGHEDYQEINGVRYPFDDKLIVAEFLTVIDY